MSVERVGGVEPETVTLWRHRMSRLWSERPPRGSAEAAQWEPRRDFVLASRLASVEEELRQAREVAHSRLRDRARLVRRAERAEADLDLLIGRFALVSVRSGMRAQALQLAEECITENLANGEGVDSQPAVLDAIFVALKYEIADEPDGAHPGAKPPIQSTSVSPVGQGDPGQEQGATFASMDECIADLQERQRTASGGQGVRDDDSEATR